MSPSLVTLEVANLTATFSPRGRLNVVFIFLRLKLPFSILTLPDISPITGRAVIRFIAPPTEFLPNRVPCGPLSTSTRSRSKKSPSCIVYEPTGKSLT